MAAVGVIGSGTWGTALAILLAGNGHRVDLWSALPEEARHAEGDPPPSEPGAGGDPAGWNPRDGRLGSEPMGGKDLLVMAVPSVYVRQTAAKMRPWISGQGRSSPMWQRELRRPPCFPCPR